MLKDILPDKARAVAYAVFAVLAIGLGAVQVWFASAGTPQPDWVGPSLAVFTFVAAGFGFTAQANTPSRGKHVAE